jgi:hypothetical protein
VKSATPLFAVAVLACAGACRAPESADASTDASADAARVERAHGPFEAVLAGTRKIYYVIPNHRGKARLIANLHGVCNRRDMPQVATG